jgi:hypothetical protein
MSRHIKFSSVGRVLTSEIDAGATYKTNRKITSIAVHCSFSPQGRRGDDASVIDRWHRERWGSGIGYHYVVLEDGTIQKGRWVDYPGAHVKGYNNHSIGIVRIGGMGKDGKAVNDATEAQYKAIIKLTKLLTKMYDLDSTDVLGHAEYPGVNKSCPLMDMDVVRDGIR